MSATVPLRGEIWEIDMNPRKGRERKGIRRCLVLSTDGLNRSRMGKVIVCPITTTMREGFVWRPRLLSEDFEVADDTWQPEPHTVEIDHLVTVDVNERMIRRLAVVVNAERIREIDGWLRKLLVPEI